MVVMEPNTVVRLLRPHYFFEEVITAMWTFVHIFPWYNLVVHVVIILERAP